jgi:uncharacterized phage infection (PIP) family protein YhgE
MSDTDEKILKALEDLRNDVTGIKTNVGGLKADVAVLRGGQKTLEAGQKTLESGQQALDLKVEAMHAYQKQAHDEIMGHLIDSTEIAGRDQKILEKRIERIEKHLGLPPLK